MKLYPVMLNISGKKAVVIGGGNVALRKVQDLVDCGAIVTVIAPVLHQAITDLQATHKGRIDIVPRRYRKGDLDGSLLVFSATDDEMTNREVYLEAAEKNILINAVDDPPNCTFFMPSWFRRNGLVIAVSTSGISPSLSGRIRRDIENNIPDSIDDTLAALQQARALLREDHEFADLSSEKRGTILKQIVIDDNLLGELIENYKNDTVKIILKKLKTAIT